MLFSANCSVAIRLRDCGAMFVGRHDERWLGRFNAPSRELELLYRRSLNALRDQRFNIEILFRLRKLIRCGTQLRTSREENRAAIMERL